MKIMLFIILVSLHIYAVELSQDVQNFIKNRKTTYNKVDIIWSKNNLEFVLYNNDFMSNICNNYANFQRFSQKTNGVEATFGYKQIPRNTNKDTDSFINKSCECIHIGGEEIYNEKRAKELEKMLQGCKNLSQTRKILWEKYKQDKSSLKLLGQEKEYYSRVYGVF
ncbi:hypothetical protein DCO58_07520 [Helicobacter saguini]|uniref:Uncharacterized protein n=1 Tax=Helicobacter saguini TaxID=1548018 RepID=A0A347VNC6_9HELI|nr:hypothetical protein [Helicobacter saguini]MWV61819.1 hypothetical protein [Helicobacter saguini]MWV67506.1 hypothetical protein [Helicobacter saguini]MWV69857.1 hypothetical protein [Helicobacter saguini]MWV72925.1 hypothetical protein [Helicobacter saguini]TLD93277.1 hypothetical protein LS64_009190 [Helicobacter saguini]